MSKKKKQQRFTITDSGFVKLTQFKFWGELPVNSPIEIGFDCLATLSNSNCALLNV